MAKKDTPGAPCSSRRWPGIDLPLRQQNRQLLTKDAARSLGLLLEHHGWLDVPTVVNLMHRRDLAALLFAPARIAALAGVSDRFNAVAS